MDKIKIAIVDDNIDQIDMVKSYINEQNDIEIVAEAYNGYDGIELLKKDHDKFDILLLDLVMPKRGGIWFLQEMKKNDIKTKTIIQTSNNTENAIREASRYNVNRFILKPYDLDYMGEVIREVSLKDISIEVRDAESKVVHILHELGIPSHIKGFQYLKNSIIMVYKDINYIGAITKLIYPEIAEMYGTTVSRVERAIRHAIEVGINRSTPDKISQYFGLTIYYEKDKPTNSEYIATIAECLKTELYSI